MLPAAGSRSAAAHESRIFFSTSPTSPGEVTLEENPTIQIAEGATYSLYLWWAPAGTDSPIGVGHDIVLSSAILTRDTDPEVSDDYLIENPSVVGTPRWDGVNAGTFGGTLLVDDANGFALSGSSLGSAGTDDPTFDAASGAYRFSKLSFTATTTGTTELRIGVGTAGIFIENHAADAGINFGWGDAAVAGNDKGATSTLADATIEVVALDPTKPNQNPLDPLDVDGNLVVEPLDALVVINELNTNGPHLLTIDPTEMDGPAFYYDVVGDEDVSPQDALVVINFLNDELLNEEGLAVSNALFSTQPAMFAVVAVPEPGGCCLVLTGAGAIAVGFARRLLATKRRS